jgi:ABC-type nickel/cobalt efflux system permease component RcnA
MMRILIDSIGLMQGVKLTLSFSTVMAFVVAALAIVAVLAAKNQIVYFFPSYRIVREYCIHPQLPAFFVLNFTV